jgi:hypothetical protein
VKSASHIIGAGIGWIYAANWMPYAIHPNRRLESLRHRSIAQIEIDPLQS